MSKKHTQKEVYKSDIPVRSNEELLEKKLKISKLQIPLLNPIKTGSD